MFFVSRAVVKQSFFSRKKRKFSGRKCTNIVYFFHFGLRFNSPPFFLIILHAVVFVETVVKQSLFFRKQRKFLMEKRTNIYYIYYHSFELFLFLGTVVKQSPFFFRQKKNIPSFIDIFYIFIFSQFSRLTTLNYKKICFYFLFILN